MGAIFIALETLSLCSLFRAAAAVHGSTSAGRPSQKAARESSLLAHQSSLLRVSSPGCQEHQRNWICRDQNSSASSSGQPSAPPYRLYISSSSLGVADSSQPRAACHFALSPFSLRPTQPAAAAKSCPESWHHLACRAACSTQLSYCCCGDKTWAELSRSLCLCPWSASSSTRMQTGTAMRRLQEAQLHTAYWRMRQFLGNRCSPFQSLVLLQPWQRMCFLSHTFYTSHRSFSLQASFTDR